MREATLKESYPNVRVWLLAGVLAMDESYPPYPRKRTMRNVASIAASSLSHSTGVQGRREHVDVTVDAVVAGLLAEVLACNPPALHRREADGYKG